MKVLIEAGSRVRDHVALVSGELLHKLGYQPGYYILVRGDSGKAVVLQPHIAATIKPNTIIVSSRTALSLGIRDLGLAEATLARVARPSEIRIEVAGVQPPVQQLKEIAGPIARALANKVIIAGKETTLDVNGRKIRLVAEPPRENTGAHVATLYIVSPGTRIVLYRRRPGSMKNDKPKPSPSELKKAIARTLIHVGYVADVDAPIQPGETIDVKATKTIGGTVAEIWIYCRTAFSSLSRDDIGKLLALARSGRRAPNLIAVLARKTQPEALAEARRAGILVIPTNGLVDESASLDTVYTRIAWEVLARASRFFQALAEEKSHEKTLFNKLAGLLHRVRAMHETA